jgi:histidyl-tRNA synthetase
MIKGIKGAHDIIFAEAEQWQLVESRARQVFQIYGYSEIRTPSFERTELFARGIGEDTDIVQKEMYTFLDKGQESLTLRPEGTASVVRAFLEHHLYNKSPLIKLYYIGPMYRHERPQAGRYRQFHQLGVEALGSDSPALDAEVLDLLVHLLESLGVKDFDLQLNTVGCKLCRSEYRKLLAGYLLTKKVHLCKDCQERLTRNPLRVLDCKRPECKAIAHTAPQLLESLCRECAQHFFQVKNFLSLLGIKYTINPFLVRGLDYYTRTAFEVTSSKLGAQNAVAGGGRYDNLVEEFGGPPTPAIGFSIGLERLLQARESSDLLPTPKVFIANMGEEAFKTGFIIAQELKRKGIQALLDFDGKSLKSQLKKADKEEASLCLIIGDEELKGGQVILRRMKTSSQEKVALKEVVNHILGHLTAGA